MSIFKSNRKNAAGTARRLWIRRTVWWKEENEKRGHNEPMCSVECCKNYISKNQ